MKEMQSLLAVLTAAGVKCHYNTDTQEWTVVMPRGQSKYPIMLVDVLGNSIACVNLDKHGFVNIALVKEDRVIGELVER